MKPSWIGTRAKSCISPKVAGGTRPRQCKPTAGRLEVCNERYGNTGWLGIAQIWINGEHITQATTKLNDTYFNTADLQQAGMAATGDVPGNRARLRARSPGREFQQPESRHVHGLHEQSRSASNEHPNQHDFEELSEIYSHLDTHNRRSPPVCPRRCRRRWDRSTSRRRRSGANWFARSANGRDAALRARLRPRAQGFDARLLG